MKEKIFIAAHHYQHADIVKQADLVADSYRLAVEAAKSDAKYIVVCGVRFMAESVATLARSDQMVIHPNPRAGCPMADMVAVDTAEKAIEKIRGITGKTPVPVTYMNSGNAMKALTGRMGGSICTSGNAKKIMTHYLEGGAPILFMPDRNLGENTALALGLGKDDLAVVSRDGSEITGARPDTRVFLWDGFCPIHKVFTVADIEEMRAAFPGINITVHPESLPEVVKAAGLSGSTEGMHHQLRDAEAGSVWGVGTEIHFVERMATLFPDKKIMPLRPSGCVNMILITPEKLAASLKAIEAHERDGSPLETVVVPEAEREDAKAALTTMVRLTDA
ncbi:MAG: quinolinate synthase NadA [Spirochaetales bacterium]|nr:quinolinate synthase NadA [Spirochaetales bacterium]